MRKALAIGLEAIEAPNLLWGLLGRRDVAFSPPARVR
jgi:hypothetical protein